MDPLIGEIKLFAGSFAPDGWFTCEGQTLSISQYTALFSLIGTTYGGDGMSTFKLPDLRGAFPTQCSNLGSPHPGGTYNYGETGGNENFTITSINLPPHTHSIVKGAGTNLTGGVSVTTNIMANSADGTTDLPTAGNAFGKALETGLGGTVALYNTTAPNIPLAGGSSSVTNTLNFNPSGLTLTPWGSGPVPMATVPPFVALQHIIAYEGVYPSRP
jgi:microcystin-dependent protein